MTDYTKTTNFAAKDALVSGNPAKVVKGTEVNTEFDNIATAVATKANLAGPTFTGTTTADPSRNFNAAQNHVMFGIHMHSWMTNMKRT